MTDLAPGEPADPTRPAPAGLSPLGAVVGTFTRPGDTFASLLNRPTWWLPLVLWAVLGAGAFLAASAKVDWETSAQEVLEKQAAKTGRAMPAEAVGRVAGVMRAWATMSTPVMLVALYFVAGLLLWGAARSFGGELRYTGALALWGHANLANCVGSLLAIATFLSLPAGSLTLQGIERAVKSNLAAFLAEGTPAPLVSLAGSVDIFSLAALALLVVGFRRVPALSRGAATALPIVLWLVYVGVKAALAFLRG